jgi:hypothetical protein
MYTALALGTATVVGILLSAYGSSTPQPPKAKISSFLSNGLEKGFVTDVGMKITWRFTPELNCPSCYRVCYPNPQKNSSLALRCDSINTSDLAEFLCSSGNLDSNGCDHIVQLVSKEIGHP